MIIKKVTINDTTVEIIASVQCENSVGLNEEDKIRKILRNFYTKEQRQFSRVAIQIAGTVILFRAIPNCKRPPTNEEIAMILQAVNCFTPSAISRPHPKKQPIPIVHRNQVA